MRQMKREATEAPATAKMESQLQQWPVQIKLVPTQAPYFEGAKLLIAAEIIRSNNISSVTVVRMEVPCCGGLEMAAKKALQNSGKFIPWQVVTISVDGKILD